MSSTIMFSSFLLFTMLLAFKQTHLEFGIVSWLLRSLEDMRISSTLPSDQVVLVEYQMCLFSAFMLFEAIYT